MPNLIGSAPNQVPTNQLLGRMAFQDPNAVVLEGSPVMPKDSGVGIKVDTAIPTWGWRDITSDIRGTCRIQKLAQPATSRCLIFRHFLEVGPKSDRYVINFPFFVHALPSQGAANWF